MTVKCANLSPAPNCGTVGPLTLATGAINCAVGPTPSTTFPAPIGAQNLVDIPVSSSSPFTDGNTLPTAASTNPLSGAPENDAVGTVLGGGANTPDGACTLPNAGTYEVQVQTQYTDFPSSASPSPKE